MNQEKYTRKTLEAFQTAQRLAGCKRIVYGLLNGLALLR